MPDERIPLKKGVGRIYNELGIKCQPLAINSGRVWPKNGPLLSNKSITVSILEPINIGMNQEDFVKLLENKIYSELDNIG